MSHKMKRGGTCAFSDGHVSTCRGVESIYRCREAYNQKLEMDKNYRFLRYMQNQRSARRRAMARFDALVAVEHSEAEQRRATLLADGWTPNKCSFGTVWTKPAATGESKSTAA